MTYHDKDIGALYGMMPLVRGMPMSLTDHVDRNPKIQLLRGRIGYVQSWIEEDAEDVAFKKGHRILRKMPKAVFVKYPRATWQMPGMSEDGVYPITPCIRQWFLDKNRKTPILEVKRRQYHRTCITGASVDSRGCCRSAIGSRCKQYRKLCGYH